jgi:F420-0:gamma-glutamyl ligase
VIEAELIQLIIARRKQLEANRLFKVSRSLLKVQEEEIRELEYIYASGDAKRLERRRFIDQCEEQQETD